MTGTLTLGTGMSLCMTELGAALGYLAMVIGILVGVLGLVMGILILLVAQWALVDLLGWIPPEVAAQSRVLPWLDILTQLELRSRLALPF